MKHNGADDITMFVRMDTEKHFEKVYKRFYPSVLFYAKKFLDDRAEAEEIAMDSFTKLWHKRLDFNNFGSVHSWLIISTKNACLNRLRQLNRIQPREVEIEHVLSKSSPEKTIEQTLIDAEVMRQIMAEVEKLPKQCKKVFLMYMEGQRNKEIAEILNISPHTVKNQLGKALKQLKMKLVDNKPALLWLIFLYSLRDR